MFCVLLVEGFSVVFSECSVYIECNEPTPALWGEVMYFWRFWFRGELGS